MLPKQLNPNAIVALKEALSQIYWYKRDLRSFLSNTLNNPAILGGINWDDYKWTIAERVVDTLIKHQNIALDDLLTLMSTVASMDDFSHLKRLENGDEKANNAKQAVLALRKYIAGHDTLINEKQKVEERKKEYAQKLEIIGSFQTKIEDLKKEFVELSMSRDHQVRGFKLEKLLKQAFELFDLDPKASFRIEGEQIDGAFTFDGVDYLFEAKWTDNLISADSLDSFSAKVSRKLDNTLGLFLSINGFSGDAVKAHSAGRKVLILMDGSELMAVFEGRIDLKDLLLRKRQHASRTGDIYIRIQDLL